MSEEVYARESCEHQGGNITISHITISPREVTLAWIAASATLHTMGGLVDGKQGNLDFTITVEKNPHGTDTIVVGGSRKLVERFLTGFAVADKADIRFTRDEVNGNRVPEGVRRYVNGLIQEELLTAQEGGGLRRISEQFPYLSLLAERTRKVELAVLERFYQLQLFPNESLSPLHNKQGQYWKVVR